MTTKYWYDIVLVLVLVFALALALVLVFIGGWGGGSFGPQPGNLDSACA